MALIEPWHFYLMALLYIFAGITHFFKSKWYLAIIPSPVPHKLLFVYLTGLLEIYLGLLLFFPEWKPIALSGIIIMLVLYFPVHVYMIYEKRFLTYFPSWLLWLRLPLQLLLILWAFSYFRTY